MAAAGSELVKELSFYGAYHSNFENQLVHMVFVPLIIWSLFVFLAVVSWSAKRHWALNLSTPVLLFYVAYYLAFDRTVGLIAAVFYTLVWLSANSLVREENRKKSKLVKGTSMRLAIATHIASWVFQVVVGHGFFEGRKPALLDSLFQAFTMAPLFVVYETIFMMGFNLDLKAQIDLNVARMHKDNNMMRV